MPLGLNQTKREWALRLSLWQRYNLRVIFSCEAPKLLQGTILSRSQCSPELPGLVGRLLTVFHLAPIFQKLALKTDFRPKCRSINHSCKKKKINVIILIMEETEAAESQRCIFDNHILIIKLPLNNCITFMICISQMRIYLQWGQNNRAGYRDMHKMLQRS